MAEAGQSEALTFIEEVFPDDQDEVDAAEDLDHASDVLEEDDDLEITVDPAPEPIGRSWAYDFVEGQFVRAGHGPMVTRRAGTIRTWIEKCLRTHQGAHPIHPDGYGIEQPIGDYLSAVGDQGLADLEDAITDAVLFHPAITRVEDMTVELDETLEGDAAVEIGFRVILDDETDVTFDTTLQSGLEPING